MEVYKGAVPRWNRNTFALTLLLESPTTALIPLTNTLYEDLGGMWASRRATREPQRNRALSEQQTSFLRRWGRAEPRLVKDAATATTSLPQPHCDHAIQP